LKAYDDQIAGIDALADAEARLTAKKDYETKRREMIDQRETDRGNYLVERRLAVYEGRAFDVRKLDREEVLAQRNSNQEIQDLDTDRLSQLQSEQRDLAKQAISNQKDLAEKQFQEVLDSFDRFIEDVKNKSFATQEEFAAALKKVGDQANVSSSDLAKVFAKNIGELPAIIAGVRDPSIKMFSANMDDLIREASKKFGVDNKVASPSTVLGAVRMMAIGSEEGFKAAFNPTFATTYVQPAVDAIAKITSSLSEKGNKNNIADIWQKAGNDAFEKLKGELNRDIAFPKILASFSNLLAEIKPLVDQIVTQAAKASSALQGIGGAPEIASIPQSTIDEWTKTATGLMQTGFASPAQRTAMAASAARIVSLIASNILRGVVGIKAILPTSGLTPFEQGWAIKIMAGINLPGSTVDLSGGAGSGPLLPKMYNGGSIGQYGRGGFLEAPASQGIPALLHGGEYIINHKAVEKFGKGNLERINSLKNGGAWRGFASGGYMTAPGFANGGYMTAPGFANGGYMTAPGFARGGAVRRRPKDSEPINPSDDSSLRTFTNNSGQSYTVPNVNIRSGKATGTTMHMLDWAAIARSESGPDWMNALGATTKTSRGVFVGPLNIARKTWQIYSNAYKKQTGVDVGNFNNPNATPSWQDQVKIAEMVAFKGIPDSQYEYYRQPKFLDGYEGVRKNRVFFQPLNELKKFDKALGFANGGFLRKAGDPWIWSRGHVSPDRYEDQIRVKGNPSSRRQIPKEQDPNSRRRGRITPIIPPEKRYPQDGSYEPDAPWAGYTNQPDPPWIHHEGGGADRQPQMTTWKDHIGEPVGSFGFPVRYRHILGYYPTDRIPLGGKKGEDVSIVWDGKNRWTRSDSGVKKYLGGMIPQFKLGGFLKPGFGLPRLKSFGLPKLKNLNPLSWFFGKKGKGGNQNQTTFEKKPAFDVNKEPWKTQIKDYKKKMGGDFPEALDIYIDQLRKDHEESIGGNSYYSHLPEPQFVGNMPPQLAYVNDAINTQQEIARGMVNYKPNNALIIRGLKKIYVNPLYWNDDDLLRNDGDAAYRIAANRHNEEADGFSTDHRRMLTMHQGISDAMATMSTYLGIPFEFAGPLLEKSKLNRRNQMLLDVNTAYQPNKWWAGQTSAGIHLPGGVFNKDGKINTASMAYNTGSKNLMWGDPSLHKEVFMHEFGHIGGFDHPHEYVSSLKNKYGGNSSSQMLNSIMSYDAAYKGEGYLLPADINAWRSNMGYNLAAPTIVTRMDAQWRMGNPPIAGGTDPQWTAWLQMQSKLNKTKKQLPKVKKFEQGGFIGPMLPKKNKSFWGKVAGVGKGAFNIGKEILRPKNSFAIAGGTLAAILATPGGPAAMVAAGMAGSAAGGGIGSLVEQAFDKKKGFQPLDIGKNMLLQGAMYGLGAGAGAIGERFIMPALAKYGTPALRGMGDVAMNRLGLAGMDAAEIPGLIKAGVSYTKSKALSSLGKGISKISPVAGDYLKAFGGSWKQGGLDSLGNTLRNYEAPVEGWFKNIFRSDNIAIRAVRENKNKEFYEEYVRLNKKPPYISPSGRPMTPMNPVPPSSLFPYSGSDFYKAGPLTSIFNKLIKFNPFAKKIGIHAGRSGLSSINAVEGALRTGPSDQLPGKTYSWLQGTVDDVAKYAKGFAERQGYGVGEGGVSQLSDPSSSSFYITRSKGGIEMDPNVMWTEARMSPWQKILAELPITSTKEELATALAQYRENSGITGVFNKVRSNIARLRNYIKREEIFLHSSPTQGLTEIKPFADAAIGNKDPLAFLKKATMQPGMTEGSWKYTGTDNASARAGWGKVKGTYPAPAPGGSVYVVRGPKGMPKSSDIFDDVDPNSFVSKNPLKVLSEIKIPSTLTQKEALAYVDSAVRRSVTRFGGPKVPRFEQGGFIGPMLPKKKKGFWGKVGGIGKGVLNMATDTIQSFVKLGDSAYNIGASVVESPMALLDKRYSFNPMKNLDNRVLRTEKEGVNWIRGLNQATGLNIPGGKTGGFGQIANNKKYGFGDAANVISTIYGDKIVGAVAKPFTPIAKRMFGPALKGVGDIAMNRLGLLGMDASLLPNALEIGTKMTWNKIKQGASQFELKADGFLYSIPGALKNYGKKVLQSGNPSSIISNPTRDLLPSVESIVGKKGIDREIIDLFDELDMISGARSFRDSNSLDETIQRLLVKARLQLSGDMPKILDEEADVFKWNEYINKMLGLRKTSGIPDEEELTEGIINIFKNIFQSPSSPVIDSDPRIIPQSWELFNHAEIQRKVGQQLYNNLTDQGAWGDSPLLRQIGKVFGIKRGQEWNLLENPEINLPIGEQRFNLFNRTKDIYTFMSKIKEKISSFLPSRSSRYIWKEFEKGNFEPPRFKKGGYLNFKEGGEVPSILHGGEYVLNAAAVKKYGLAHLEAMNQMKFNVPSAGFSVPQASYSGNMAGGMTTSTQNVNIYVDNFIGEPEWFNSMMKDYNTKILPKNQKAAGLENRVISTYNGLNRGQ
jgi:hypothetical protein